TPCPLFVGNSTLGGGLAVVTLQQASAGQDAVDAGGATGADIGIEHHEGQAGIALPGVEGMEGGECLLFLVVQPVVAGNPGVVLVGLAVAVLPRVPLGGGNADPQKEAANRDAGPLGPALDEIHDGITGIVGNPESVQGSPSCFFSWTCSSISSERTSC